MRKYESPAGNAIEAYRGSDAPRVDEARRIDASTYDQESKDLRAGYQFSSVDDYAVAPCRRTGRQTRLCSQTLTQAYVTVAILERLRLQGTLAYYPDIPLGAQGSSFDFLLGLGLHFF